MGGYYCTLAREASISLGRGEQNRIWEQDVLFQYKKIYACESDSLFSSGMLLLIVHILLPKSFTFPFVSCSIWTHPAKKLYGNIDPTRGFLYLLRSFVIGQRYALRKVAEMLVMPGWCWEAYCQVGITEDV